MKKALTFPAIIQLIAAGWFVYCSIKTSNTREYYLETRATYQQKAAEAEEEIKLAKIAGRTFDSLYQWRGKRDSLNLLPMLWSLDPKHPGEITAQEMLDVENQVKLYQDSIDQTYRNLKRRLDARDGKRVDYPTQ